MTSLLGMVSIRMDLDAKLRLSSVEEDGLYHRPHLLLPGIPNGHSSKLERRDPNARVRREDSESAECGLGLRRRSEEVGHVDSSSAGTVVGEVGRLSLRVRSVKAQKLHFKRPDPVQVAPLDRTRIGLRRPSTTSSS